MKQSEKLVNSRNVIAEVKGARYPDEIIVVVAHYDSVSKSIGGHDNASGACIVAALAGAIAKKPMARTVRFIEFSGEEFGLCGSQAYAKKHKKELEKVKLCMNVDIAGPIFGTNNSFVTGPDQLRYYLECMGKELGMGFSHSTDVYSSDNVSFSEHGVPSASITRGGGYVCEGHSINDRFTDIDAAHLAVTGDFILKFLERAANAVEWPFPREIPEDQKKKVKDYLDRMHGRDFKPAGSKGTKGKKGSAKTRR
jgi:Zn-dependent M28 family amino/carboxypeptidase